MRGFIVAATLAAGALFVGALGLVASLAGGARWAAFDTPAVRPGRVPAFELPAEPVIVTLTASDVDSVPEALEARPRAPEPAERPTDLGDVEPAAPKAKAAARKAPARKPRLFQRVGLGGARPGLTPRSAPDFDGGGSGAFAEGAPEAGADGDEAPAGASAGPTVPAAPARQRTFRVVAPSRGTVAPGPAAAPAEEAGDDGSDGE